MVGDWWWMMIGYCVDTWIQIVMTNMQFVGQHVMQTHDWCDQAN